VRIGTWNLGLHSTSPTEDWGRKAARLEDQQAQLWLLTEAHHSWNSRGNNFAISPERSYLPEQGRWAGIETSWPLTELPNTCISQHPGEEGLIIARVQLAETPVLVACSVLPWRRADKHWKRLPADPSDPVPIGPRPPHRTHHRGATAA